MFGTNPIAKKRPYTGSYAIQEVFPTIQGEGPFTGMPAVFVRLAHCCLACTYCDTDFTTSTWEPTLEDLVADIAVNRGAARLVVITGGEPMLQDIGPLCIAIVDLGLRVQIETAGVMWPSTFDDEHIMSLIDDQRITIVCSPKTGKVLSSIEDSCRDWKYIISSKDVHDPNDGLPLSSTQRKGQHLRLYRPPMRDDDRIWVQPCEEYFTPVYLDIENKQTILHDTKGSKASLDLAIAIAMKHGYRMSLQTHKLMGLP